MRRIYSFILMYCLTIGSWAQTQQGVVKTRGRMVNGKHVAGQGLSGATVTIQGRGAVLSQSNGGFSFSVPAKTFMLQGVQKNGYQLVDADATKKPHQYSSNTFYIVMETPDRQSEDMLTAERKIRRTLQRQLQLREDELEELKAQNKLTQDEYQRKLRKLYDDQQNNEKLIADMAKEYAQMDYDQMDDKNRQISDAILNGELTRADSLLRSKGDMRSRDAEITRRQQAEAQRKDEIAHQQEELAASEEGTHKLLEDFAEDCYKYHNMFKLENKHDSALYYIELRANRDTTNARWQFDAGLYCQEQNHFNKAIIYYKKSLNNFRRQISANPQKYDSYVATILNNLANLYRDTQKFTDSESLNKEALGIRRRLAEANPETYEPHVAQTLNNLAILYKETKRFTDSEALYKEALGILRRRAEAKPAAYRPDVAMTLNNLANLYKDTERYTDSETLYKEALGIYRSLAEAKPVAYRPDVAMTLNNLAMMYKKNKRFRDSETLYKEALGIYRRLAKANPTAYDPYLANTLNNLAILYKDTERYTDSESMNKEALGIRRRLVEAYPEVYETDLVQTLNNLAMLYNDTKRFTDSETLYKEALGIFRKLAEAYPEAYETDLAQTLINLASLYNDTKRFTDSETLYKEALEIYKRLVEADSIAYEPKVAQILYVIGLCNIIQKKYAEAITSFVESSEIYRQLVLQKPALKQEYLYSLYWLSRQYSQTNQRISVYTINQELLPLVKDYYSSDAESYRNIYLDTLGSQSFCAIFMKQFYEAEQYAREGLQLDSTQHWIASNLAAALLFQGKYEEAEKIYRRYKDELKDSFLDDFKQFAEAGVIPKKRKTDVERIKMLLEE